MSDSKEFKDWPEEAKRKIQELETDLRHLRNELRLTRKEYDSSVRNYFEIYSHMEQMVHKRTEELENVNRKLVKEIDLRDQAEEALRESEHKYKLLAENTNDIIWITNEKGDFLYVSPSVERLLGYKQTDILGLHYSDFITEEYIYLADEAVERMLEASGSTAVDVFFERLEFTVRIADDNVLWTETTIAAVFDEKTREIAGFSGVTRDISERKKTMETLAEREHFLQSVFDAIPDGISVLDTDLNILRINKGMEEHFDIRLRDIAGQKCYKIYQGRNEVCEFCPSTRAIKTNQTHVELVAHTTKQGETIWLEVSAFPLTNPEGEVVSVIEYVKDVTKRYQQEQELAKYRDSLEELVQERTERLIKSNRLLQREISERRQTENALRESEEKYRLFAENFQGIAFRCDLDFLPIFFHGQSKEITGYPPEDFLSGIVRWDKLIHPDDMAKLSDSIANMATIPNFSESREYRIIHKDGEIVWVHESTQNVCDPEGKPCFVQGAIYDITKTKSAQEALKKAKELAEEANRLKSRFVFNVSHEIRTPLNGIIGFAEIIHETNDLKLIHNHSEIILQESDALLMLVNDLLDHAKIEAGKLFLDNRPLDLFNLLENIMANAELQARSKGLEFTVKVDKGTPKYGLGDFLRLRQILLNLVSNAIKFTENGGVTIHVETLERNSERAKLKFNISDTGIGIPKHKQEAIFKSFTQADLSTTRKYGGTGLGTTIAQQLVRLMGGDIGVLSNEGEGSTFWFTLPYFLCDRPEDELDQIPDMSPGHLARPKEPAGTILLAEDYLTNQEIARLHIESAGYFLVIVENGKQAVEACRKRKYDLILMDLQMPILDGYEATKQIRASGGPCKDIPILAMTASAEASTREACLSAGMNDVLTKPIRQASFIKAVREWLHPEERQEAVDLDDTTLDDLPNQEATSSQKTETTSTSEACFDYATALEEFGGNEEILQRVITQFVENATIQIEALQEMIEAERLEEVGKESHKIKGGAANLTAYTFAKAAEALEKQGKNGEQEGIWTLYSDLQNTFNAFKETLQKHGHLPETTSTETQIDDDASSDDDFLDSLLGESTTNEIKKLESDSPINYALALEEFGGNKDLLDRVLVQFIDHAEEQIPLMAKALENNDLANLAKEAHKIKGGSANLTAMELSAIAEQVEKKAKADDSKDLKDSFEKLKMQFERLRSYRIS